MQSDTTAKRRARYKNILKGSGLFFEAAGKCEQKNKDIHFSKKDAVISDVSTFVLAPAMNAYVMWVLKEALKKKQKRLYFLARDGYFMYTTAKILCEKLHLPIECRYLSCSRYSMRIPLFHFNEPDALEYICRGGIDVSIDKVLNRAGLTDKEKEKVKEELGGEFCSGVIAYADLGKLRSRLEKCEFFLECMREHSEAVFPAARDYLEQEGLFDDVSYAFVDSGWVGSMQKVMGQILERSGKKKRLSGYYFGLYELPPDVNAEDYSCFYFSPTKGTKRKVGFSNCLFESIFSAPHGMTLYYEKKGSEVYPVYADIRDDNKAFNEEIGGFLNTFTEIVAQMLCDKKDAGVKSPVRLLSRPEDFRVTSELLTAFMSSPSRGEALYFGSLPFSDDVLDENEQQVAAPLTQKELSANHPVKKIMILTGLSKEKIKESAWFEGSAVRSGSKIDAHLRAYAAYKWLLYGKKEVLRLKGNIRSGLRVPFR